MFIRYFSILSSQKSIVWNHAKKSKLLKVCFECLANHVFFIFWRILNYFIKVQTLKKSSVDPESIETQAFVEKVAYGPVLGQSSSLGIIGWERQ
jgi:hypothetical protein